VGARVAAHHLFLPEAIVPRMTRPAPIGLAPLGIVGILLAGGCNRYELFNEAGYEQAKFSNEADILFVIDNSPSMADETAALGLNFNVFIDTLTSVEGGAEQVTEDLSDAVDNYLAYTQQRGKFLDYQLGITTTGVQYADYGATDGIDPGETGSLLGSPTVIAKGDDGIADTFRKNLLCNAAYWNTSDIPTDPTYECGSGTPDQISQEYLDCVCGFDTWEGKNGSGDEEPLEAALMALCRSVDDPPETCFDSQSAFGHTVPTGGDAVEYCPFFVDQADYDAWVEDNPDTACDFETHDTTGVDSDFLRPETTVVVVVVSDEGDNSRRLAQGEDDPQVYLDAFAEFDRTVKFVEIGPNYDPETKNVKCVTISVPTWSAERMVSIAEQTGGFYSPIASPIADDPSGECGPTDFAKHLEDLGALLNNLQTAFQLQSIPDISTIRVWVDDQEVSEAKLIEGTLGQPDAVYDDGWSYDSAQNAVVFWGDAIPDYNADVRIYYRPLEGKPRELPF